MLYAIYFIYGLCVMFYFMMSWPSTARTRSYSRVLLR